MREGNTQRGFTVIELMVVVVIIALLAAVVIPSFMRETTRGKAKSEVSPVFAELSTREDAYKQESATGEYLAAAACPASATTAGTDVITGCLGAGTPWTLLRVQPHATKMTCSYTVAVGLSTDDPAADAAYPSWVTGLSTPSTTWYFIKAVCPETEYFTASWDTKIRSKDGK